MSTGQVSLQDVCTKNRAEELGHDVWAHFVIPLYFDNLSIPTPTKPRVIVGGRGSGKTMLLRYLSHNSAFSRNRRAIPADAFRHLGLYWKVDTHFLGMMARRGVDDHVWDSAFDHFLALVLSEEIVACLENIARSNFPDFTLTDLTTVTFRDIGGFDSDLSGDLSNLRNVLRRRRIAFQAWVNNPRKLPEPLFLPGKDFVLAMIEELKGQVTCLADSFFFVYIDEYENLRENQQRLINTYLKHSELPLIFNIAAKHNGMKTRETVGDESISDIADYRTHDLDQYSLAHTFRLFAAEILFLRFATMADVAPVPVDVDQLRDPAALPARREREYAERVIGAAQRIFPGLSQRELAQTVFADSAVLGKLRADIALALRKKESSIPTDAFVRPTQPEASIVASALLYRPGSKPEEILGEMDRLEVGQSNRFTGGTNWIHNNFVGCVLQLYAPYNRACPVYAGFDTFIKLAGVNLRYFLELCHKSLKQASLMPGIQSLSIAPEEQAESARQASTEFLREIRTFGRLGNRLHAFVLTIGSLFALAHRRPTQSQPEITHFSVRGGPGVMGEGDEEFFREAVKWSVLREEMETKTKEPTDIGGKEWVLAPIYAPYFHISYVKRRSLAFTIEDVRVMIRGDYEARRQLLRRFMKEWILGPSDVQTNLFGHLEAGD